MAKNIERRIGKIENQLGRDEGPKVITIVHFAGPLPPERTENGITYRFISFDSIRKGGN